MRRLPPLLLAGLAAGMVWGGTAAPARASSHAEAPMISEDPEADGTDLYAFRSPENPDKVVILANYIPLEEPSGGPNWHQFSDQVLYQIKVDRNNDAADDLIFSFVFTTKIKTPGTFLNFLGPVTSLTSDGDTVDKGNNVNPNLNRYQTYDLLLTTVSRRGRRTTVLARNVISPPVNVGPTTTPNYEQNLGQKAIHTIPGSNIRVFAGQRDDPFFIDLGAVFDLLQVRPFRSLSALQPANTPGAAGIDTIAGFNCHTLALEVPITFLTGTTAIPGPQDASRVLGFYTTASRPRVTVLRPGRNPTLSRDMVQVSRLGSPLVNELFIPIAEARGRTKDFWNSTEPERDKSLFQSFFQFPEPALRLAQIYPALRGVIPGVKPDASGFDGTPRTDLLGGFSPLLNFAPDLLRLDVSVQPVSPGNRLAGLAGDAGGFPNGRRLSDDVVDIYIRAAAGALVPGNITVGGNTTTRLGFLNSINLGDGVDANTDQPFLTRFPFAATPTDGVNPKHSTGGSPTSG
jgi:Domain of unknown function (DUF4331)